MIDELETVIEGRPMHQKPHTRIASVRGSDHPKPFTYYATYTYQ